MTAWNRRHIDRGRGRFSLDLLLRKHRRILEISSNNNIVKCDLRVLRYYSDGMAFAVGFYRHVGISSHADNSTAS
jgi:hypothetical protein